MGNKSSSISKEEHGNHGAKDDYYSTTQPYYDAPNRKNNAPKRKKVVTIGTLPTQQQGNNDEAFETYIKDARVKMKSKSNIGVRHEDLVSNNAMPVVVANNENETNNKKENERDHFSDFIQNARNKLRTVTRKSSSIRRG